MFVQRAGDEDEKRLMRTLSYPTGKFHPLIVCPKERVGYTCLSKGKVTNSIMMLEL